MVDTLGRNSEVVVFVVDDDPPSRSSAATLIGARGYRVQTFESAESFLANYDGVTCGVLVTDYLMPGMDGLEFQRQLAERKADLPIILVSGFANIATAVRAMRAGAIAMLEKPYEPSQLLDAIEEATSLARRWFELRRRNAEAKVFVKRVRTASYGNDFGRACEQNDRIPFGYQLTHSRASSSRHFK